jgi:hypothetical protein
VVFRFESYLHRWVTQLTVVTTPSVRALNIWPVALSGRSRLLKRLALSAEGTDRIAQVRPCFDIDIAWPFTSSLKLKSKENLTIVAP